jgi:hypothetical protein
MPPDSDASTKSDDSNAAASPPAAASFAADYPNDPELGRLLEAFNAGDYKAVRDGAPGLAERASDPKVRRAALDLRARIDPDPLARYLLWISVALLGALVVYSYTHAH